MTATMTQATPADAPQGRPSGGGKKTPAVKLTLAGDPSVQLLPPSIRDRALSRSRMRTGVLLVVLGVVIAGALIVAATVRASSAQLALAAAGNRTADLLAEQAQYADAVRIATLVEQIEELEVGATTNEIAWADLFGELLARVPVGGELMEVTATNQIPWEPASGVVAPVQAAPEAPSSGEGADTTTVDAPVAPAPPVGPTVIVALDITLSSASLADATNYLRSLMTLDGYEYAVIRAVTVGTDGLVTSTISLQLNLDAASGRFVAEGDAEGSATTDEADGAAVGTEG